jgi:hypothetical protein
MWRPGLVHGRAHAVVWWLLQFRGVAVATPLGRVSTIVQVYRPSPTALDHGLGLTIAARPVYSEVASFEVFHSHCCTPPAPADCIQELRQADSLSWLSAEFAGLCSVPRLPAANGSPC